MSRIGQDMPHGSLPDTSGRWWSVVLNPICVKCIHSRLRWKHILSWGLITLTLTAFVCLMVYLTATERQLMTPAEAARAMLLPLIIIQAVILMLLGTGAVASGLAVERDKGLVAYHRMTPMSPTAKMVGYLFGLPIREYFLFLLTIPFVVFAVVVSEFAVPKLLHFYAVFFSSVWVYHMTGMVVGMVWNKPWRSALITQGLVVLLYLVLPQLSAIGLTFFEFLTVRPTFKAMLLEELQAVSPSLRQMAAQRFPTFSTARQVGFFDWMLHPTTYTLLVQGFLLCTLVVVVLRKWKNEHAHPFSKAYGLFFHFVITAFLVGSIWPILSNEILRDLFMRQFPGDHYSVVLFLLLMTMMTVSGLFALLVLHVTTPSRFTMAEGIRLAMKRGQGPRVSPASDASSSLMLAAGIAVLTGAGMWVLIDHARRTGLFLSTFPPPWVMAEPLMLGVTVVLFVQGIRERFSTRLCFVMVFLLWMIPAFTAMVLYSAKNAWVLGTYIALPNPLAALLVSMLWVYEHAGLAGDEVFDLPSGAFREHLPMFASASLALYSLLAVGIQTERWRWHRAMLAREGKREPVRA